MSSLLESLIAGRLGAGVSGRTVPVEGAAPSLSPQAGTICSCGTLSRLTLVDPPASGAYAIIFTSGETPTTTVIPSTVLGLESFAAAANTVYEINVLDNRAVWHGWPLPAGE